MIPYNICLATCATGVRIYAPCTSYLAGRGTSNNERQESTRENENAMKSTTLLIITLTNLILPTLANIPIVCYDSRYAEFTPALAECAFIIAHLIVTPTYGTRTISFSRRPVGDQVHLPRKWNTPLDTCRIIIDIPHSGGQPFEVEEATMLQVKEAAFEVLRDCVARGHHLGGIAAVGRHRLLLVRVEGGENEGSRAVA
ncbi:MAG: hypothetical protein Q9210_000221 [Variospora velana]